MVLRKDSEKGVAAKSQQPMNYLPLLVIMLIVAIIVFISLNENPVTVVALPTMLPTGTETPVSPTATITTGTIVTLVTQTPTPTGTSAVQSTLPTVRPTNRRRFVLRYDDNTLFMRNDSGNQVEVSSFAFERLDMSGNPLNHIEGSRWARLYPYIRPQSCIKIMFWDKISNLSPPSCQRINSEVHEQSGSSLDFWTPQEGSAQFRVLWNGEEIGRCTISAGECEVFAP